MYLDLIQDLAPSGGWGLFRPALVGEPLWTRAAENYSTIGLTKAASVSTIKVTQSLAIQRLDGLLGVENGPAYDTIQGAKALYYMAAATAEPEVHFAPDGEVSLVWRRGARYLELGVDADGAVSFYGRTSRGKLLLGDLDAVPDSLPKSVVAFLGGFNHGVRVRGSVAKRA